MVAPTYHSTTVTDFGTDATAHLVNMPATVNAGDLLLAIASFDSATTTITTPTGWTKLAGNAVSFDPVIGVYAKVAAGTEGGTTVDVVTSNVQRGSVHVCRFSSWAGHLDGVEIAVAPIGTTAAIALSVGSVSRDVHWIVAQVKSTATVVWAAGPPTGYSNNTKSGVSEDTANSASIASATRTNTAASEEVTTLWNAASNLWALLIAVLPVGALKSSRPTAGIGV